MRSWCEGTCEKMEGNESAHKREGREVRVCVCVCVCVRVCVRVCVVGVRVRVRKGERERERGRIMIVDAFVVRGRLDDWVCACVRFTEQLRAAKANLIMDHVRFVPLDLESAPRLVVQIRPVLQVLDASHVCHYIRRLGVVARPPPRIVQDIVRDVASARALKEDLK